MLDEFELELLDELEFELLEEFELELLEELEFELLDEFELELLDEFDELLPATMNEPSLLLARAAPGTLRSSGAEADVLACAGAKENAVSATSNPVVCFQYLFMVFFLSLRIPLDPAEERTTAAVIPRGLRPAF